MPQLLHQAHNALQGIALCYALELQLEYAMNGTQLQIEFPTGDLFDQWLDSLYIFFMIGTFLKTAVTELI